ncbi:MAG: polysaccharide biosynthesis/export family protein [Planctomycetota bacterium]
MTLSTDPSPVRLGPDDRIRIDVASRPEFSTPAEGIPLDERGALHLPLIGRVELGGLDIDDANAVIEAAFSLYLREPYVALSVAEWHSRAYHVLGHVREPGRKALVGRVTALEALSAGGAFMSGADRSHCFLARPHADGLEVHEFDGESPDARGLVEVAPGDIIVVRRTGNQDFQEDLLPVLSGLGLSALYVSGRPLAN